MRTLARDRDSGRKGRETPGERTRDPGEGRDSGEGQTSGRRTISSLRIKQVRDLPC
jgi:hypothetical protein